MIYYEISHSSTSALHCSLDHYYISENLFVETKKTFFSLNDSQFGLIPFTRDVRFLCVIHGHREFKNIIKRLT